MDAKIELIVKSIKSKINADTVQQVRNVNGIVLIQLVIRDCAVKHHKHLPLMNVAVILHLIAPSVQPWLVVWI